MRVSEHVYVLSGSYFGAVGDGKALGDVYGIRTDQGWILIDCGIPDGGLEIIRETMADYGIDAPVRYLIITHAHFDHCGSALAVQKGGAQVIVGAQDAPTCRAGGGYHLGSPFEEHDYPAFEPDILIDGDMRLTLCGVEVEFIMTPGHTPGSMMVSAQVDGKTMLFTGDALQPGGGQLDDVSFGWQGDLGFSREAIVSSMLKLAGREADMILPGHGKVCLRNGTEFLKFAAKQALLTMR
jgi:glyoxylase-like metal-dependent hydrolase (beta-lactamase superfamily II)